MIPLLLSVVAIERFEVGRIDLRGIDRIDPVDDQLHQALVDLRGTLHPDEVRFLKRVVGRLIGVPFHPRDDSGSISQLDQQIGIALAVGSHTVIALGGGTPMAPGAEALLSRASDVSGSPHLRAYKQRMEARPAYQRGIAKGGPVVMGA